MKPGRYIVVRECKNPKVARNLILILAGLLVIFTLTFNKAQAFFQA